MTTVILSETLVTPEQTAEMLGVSVGTLGVWRCTRRYPLPFVKVGRSVKYKLADLERFVERRTIGGEVE